MNAKAIAPGSITLRAVKLLFSATALGELAVGIAIIVFPRDVAELLLAAPIEGTGIIVARIMGVAILAMSVTWWRDRHPFDERQARHVAPTFIVYNLGVGLVFLFYVWGADRLMVVPWLVAAVHLLAAGAFAAALTRLRPVANVG